MPENASPEIEELLLRAQSTQESKDVQKICRHVLELDPENKRAWLLLAKHGAWDSKTYDYDAEKIVGYARHALELADESQKQEAASDIYVERKHQIAALLEANMMMPSYSGAKQLHATMMYWLKLLSEIPYLTPDILEAEITLCDNLCLRSRMSIMPGDRLVYTAYTTLNGKEPYGATFRSALASYLDRGKAENEQERAMLAKQALALVSESKNRLRSWRPSSPESERDALCRDLGSLKNTVSKLRGLTNKTMLIRQIEELQRQRNALKPIKIFKRKELNARIAEYEQEIASIDADLEPILSPIEEHIRAIHEALGI